MRLNSPDAWILIVLTVLLWVHGLIYALWLPPWDLVDEEQHFDYINLVATHGRAPVVGQDYLSPDIVAAIIQTDRWTAYHWPRPASARPQDWGLEGYSYEGNQPPLFYLMLAPLYRLINADVVTRLFVFRLALLAFSPLLLWMIVRIWKRAMSLARLDAAGVLLISGWLLSTDRAMMMVRVDNDWLAWLLGIAIVGAVVAFFQSAHPRRALWSAAALTALGLLTKLTLVIYVPVIIVLVILALGKYPTMREWLRDSAVALFVVAAAGGGIALANSVLYSDPSGLVSFNALMRAAGYQPLPWTWDSLFSVGASFLQTEWVTWWHGLDILGGWQVVPALFDLSNVLLMLLASVGVIALFAARMRGQSESPWALWCLLMLLIVLNVAGTFIMVIMARYPSNQARFLTAADASLLLLIGAGLRRALPALWRVALVGIWLILLLGSDALYLIFYVRQYFYS